MSEENRNLNKSSWIPTTNNNTNFIGLLAESVYFGAFPLALPTILVMSTQGFPILPAFSVCLCIWHSLGWAVSPLKQDWRMQIACLSHTGCWMRAEAVSTGLIRKQTQVWASRFRQQLWEMKDTGMTPSGMELTNLRAGKHRLIIYDHTALRPQCT